MIDETKTAKALLDKLYWFVSDYNANKPEGIADDVVLIPDGSGAKPDINLTYIEEKILTNNDSPIGMSFSDSDIQRPIYQVKVFSPKQEYKWPNLDLSMRVKKEFHNARLPLESGAQTIQVESVDTSALITLTDSHVTVISVNLSIIATNN